MSKILVTGSNGLVGWALKLVANDYPDDEFIFCSREDGDLTDKDSVIGIYAKHNPDYVIHAAAKVGGIGANIAKPANLFYDNILMNSFMIHYAHDFGVKKILCYSSVCTYPDDVDVLREDLQQSGKPYDSNFAYGYAKRMIDIQIKAYKRQYGTNYFSIISTNLYGPNDNFSLTDGHVIPCLIHKCHLAKKNNIPLDIWGDGSSLREFVYSEDVAKLTIELLKKEHDKDKIIISNNIEFSIKQVIEMICEYMDFDGEVNYDLTKPSGQHRRPSDTSLLRGMIPDLNLTNHREGIKKTVDWFVQNYPNIRF